MTNFLSKLDNIFFDAVSKENCQTVRLVVYKVDGVLENTKL